MQQPAQNRYDQTPYPSFPFPQTHPDHLASIATLLGMEPAPIGRCRVLELGCAGGGNLIPMAQNLPESEFVGVDLSARQVNQGKAAIKALGLKNIVLKPMDILEVDESFGRFDYIIAHGVYSWVPPQVQNKLLQICRQNLAPNGVAYVSYNVYPGWRMHNAIREMMLYHTRHTPEPAERVAQARNLLDFLTEADPTEKSPQAGFLHAYANYVKERFASSTDNDVYLLHNELADINEPLYFYQFAERAAQHGLRYLAEAQFQTMLASNLPADVAAELRQMAGDTIWVEQYLDFLRNRTFRQTLLCHRETRLQARLTPERLAKFYVASSALPEKPELDVRATVAEKFCASKGAVLTTDHPVTKAAMLHLSKIWPQAESFTTLLHGAWARVNNLPPGAATPAKLAPDAELLASNLLKAYGYSEALVELHVHPLPFVLEISERPVASPVARYQAQTEPVVTNLRHESAKLGALNHRLLPFLDGSRDRAALLPVVEKLLAESSEQTGGKQQVDSDPVAMLESVLRALANAALLVA